MIIPLIHGPQDDTTSSIWVSPSQTTTYSVTVDDGNGTCTDDVEIAVNQTTSYTDITACESYEWNGETYTESGTYSYSGSSNNYSMSFNDNSVGSNQLASLTNDFTIQGWINPESSQITSPSKLFYLEDQPSESPNLHLEYNSANNRITCSNWGGAGQNLLTSNSVINPNSWIHVSLVYENTSLKLYINGILDNQVSVSLSVPIIHLLH